MNGKPTELALQGMSSDEKGNVKLSFNRGMSDREWEGLRDNVEAFVGSRTIYKTLSNTPFGSEACGYTTFSLKMFPALKGFPYVREPK